MVCRQEHELSEKETEGILPCAEESLKSVQNMISLSDLNEPAILHDLRLRFKLDEIYTFVRVCVSGLSCSNALRFARVHSYVSSILVAVNPFKMLPVRAMSCTSTC
jgi:myosin heavy subunit